MQEKKWRMKFPGACVTEYESIMQIVINILIGWNQEEYQGTMVFLIFHKHMQIVSRNRQDTHSIHIYLYGLKTLMMLGI